MMQGAHDDDDDMEGDDGDWEGWAEPEIAPTRDLFSDRIFESAGECLDHAVKEYGLDLVAIATRLRLDIYGRVRLVNYVRACAAKATPPATIVEMVNKAAHADGVGRPWDDDGFLMPVLFEDPLLYSIGSSSAEGHDDFGDAGAGAHASGSAAADDATFEDDHADESAQTGLLLQTIAEMRVEMASLLGLHEAAEGAEAAESVGGDAASATQLAAVAADAAAPSAPPAPPLLPPHPRAAAEVASQPAASACEASEGQYGSAEGAQSAYFDSYAKLSIHEEMLSDHVRTGGYLAAIEGVGSWLEGKAVLDVGCGTGILSMMAARAGAARVVGVDASGILDLARRLVAANSLDGKVGG